MTYCSYYQAEVLQKECWFFVATLRSFEHLAFDRTLDTSTSTFEFLVPSDTEIHFLELMSYFTKNGIIKNLSKKENRFISCQ